MTRGNARAAAAFDPRWNSFYSDVRAALDQRESLPDQSDDADHFFEIDERVQEECSDAGRDIGELEP